MLILCLLLSLFSFADEPKVEKPPRKAINLNEVMTITYGSAKWNLDPKKIDSASVIFRDAKSGKSVLIIVDETAPDSSIFKGTYLIRWTDVGEIVPEIYIPPQDLVKKENWPIIFKNLIASGKLKRKPFISHKEDSGERIFDVFDTVEQAKVASQAYDEKKKAALEAQKAKTPTAQLESAMKTKAAAAAVLEAEKLAKAQAEALRLAQEAAARETQRARLEQIERQKEEERRRKQAELNEAEKARRKAQAKKLAAEGLEAYKAGEFNVSEQKFHKSRDLDPNDDSLDFYYGVALFKNDKFNESLVILSGAKKGNFDPAERDYFIALDHMKLKETQNALAAFQKVKEANHKQLSPTAAFYQGVIYFNDLQYEKAKDPFQEVLDNQDSDPRLDAQAEQYIDQIARILYFAAQKEKKWLLSGTFGLQYDSNILYTSNTSLDQGTASNSGGIRYLMMGSGQWRPIYEKDKEFGPKLSALYLLSQDSTFTTADPLLFTFSLPYVAKGTMSGKGSKWDITPGYEVLNQNVTGVGAPQNIMNSGTFNLAHTLVLSEERISTINFNYRSDTFVTPPAESANRYALSTTQMKFLDKERKTILSGDLGYALNSAVGTDYYYTRIDAKATYMKPWKWDSTGFVSLAYFTANYSQKAPARLDNNYSLNLGFSRKISELLQGAATANYTIQKSTDTSFTYNKWTLMYAVSANYDL